MWGASHRTLCYPPPPRFDRTPPLQRTPPYTPHPGICMGQHALEYTGPLHTIAPHKTLCLFTMDCDLDERMKQWKAASFWVVQQAQGRQVALQQPKLLPGASGSALIL